jgi:hypothetical protein
MAVNPIKPITAASATATNGSVTITVFGNVSTINAFEGTIVHIGDFTPVEAVSGTGVNLATGESTITLREPWPEVTTTARLIAFNAIEGLGQAIQRARDIVTNTAAIEALAGFGFVEKTGATSYQTTTVTAAGKALLDDATNVNQRTTLGLGTAATGDTTTGPTDTTTGRLLKVGDLGLGSQLGTSAFTNADEVYLRSQTMTKAESDALAALNIEKDAGSGFSQWGKQRNGGTFTPVNNGMTANFAIPNILRLGYDFNVGVSRTQYSIVNVNGVAARISSTDVSSEALSQLTFPPAPDGTKTYDSSNGAVVQHATSAAAFSAETATNKVIISRQDFTFLESLHEVISDKDVVYPLGNVQYGVSTWEGITLSNTLVAQGYSAFGEWDTVTKGYGVTWSTLTLAQKLLFVQDKENNIYLDGDDYVQIRYRIRVIEGLGDTWLNAKANGSNNAFRYDSTNHVIAQGKSIVPVTLVTFVNNFRYTSNGSKTIGAYSLGTNGTASDVTTIAHRGLCFAIPIALVQRRNEGAYHPFYNSNGTRRLNTTTSNAQGEPWYSGIARPITSTEQCFNIVDASTSTESGAAQQSGYIGLLSGRSDDKFYDAIYASDVEDNRMSTEDLPYSEIRKRHKRDSISGEVRGFEGVPFTDTFVSNKTSTNTGLSTIIVLVSDVLGYTAYSGSTIKVLGKALNNTTGKTYTLNAISSDGNKLYINTVESISHLTGQSWSLCLGRLSTHKQANPTWTDIVGTPVNIAATFPNGVEGQWIPILPDGTTKEFFLNRKSSTPSGQLALEESTNNGSSWTAANTVSFDTTRNSRATGHLTTSVVLYHYETQAHFTQVALNSKVLDLGGVMASNGIYNSTAVILNSSLIGKVNKNPSTAKFISQVPLNSNTLSGGLFFASVDYAPEHNTLGLGFSNNSPACKTLDYLSSLNGVATLNYAYKEMVYDDSLDGANEFIQVTTANQGSLSPVAGNYYKVDPNVSSALAGLTLYSEITSGGLFNDFAWVILSDGRIGRDNTSGSVYFTVWDGNGFGDNNKFEIIDNQGTLTDDNGKPALYGSALFYTQYFIKER